MANVKNDNPVNASNVVDYIIDFESGNTSIESVQNLFSYLYKSDMLWSLQGSYQRAFWGLVEQEYLTETGEIL